MLQLKRLVVVAVCLTACASQTYSDASSDKQSVVPTRSALGNEDQNDFRNRKTENKLLSKRKEDCSNDPRVALNLVSSNVCVGADLFFREPFGGNGRACGSCHTAQFDFTISPEFIDSLAPDDPLFVAEFNPALAQLERPDLMHSYGLILENVDGAEAPTTKFVMRSVPHTFSLTTSITPAPVVNPDGTGVDGTTQPPIQRTGWSGDGAPAPGGLKQFQVGAIFQHYTKSLNRVAGTDFTPATDEQLTRIEDFLLSIGRSADVDLTTVSLTDPGADQGRTTYLASRCNGCHRNAGASTAAGFNRNFDTGVETVRVADLNTLGISHDGGFGGGAPGAPFNHDADHDGVNDSFGNGTFSTPPLIEAADTGPFFHTNAFATIEDAITFYTTPAFANSPAGGGTAIALTPTEIANIGKLLRVLNASFNCKLAAARLDAAVRIADQYKNHFKGLQFGLLDAAQAEVRDAIADLADVSINAAVRVRLNAANQAIDDAFSNSSPVQRLAKARVALTEVTGADSGLGTGLGYQVGPGSIMF
jgi:cytochrome c peroxidase